MNHAVAQRLASGVSVHELYPELEECLRPMVLQLSRQFAPSLGVDVDDAVQEARVAVLLAFQSYDYNRSRGGIKAYARQAIKNAFCGLAYTAATRARCPHTVYTDGGEVKVIKHRRLASLEDLMETGDWVFNQLQSDSTDKVAEANAIASKLSILRMRLYRRLGPRERAVFRLKAQPPEAFLVYLRNVGADEPNNLHIASYLGITKNSVDYSLLKIRGEFRRLAEAEFSDLVATIVRDGDWPMVHVSDKADDVEFVRKVIQERKLDPRPLPGNREIQLGNNAGRIIERYHWGAVLHLQLNEHRATVVVEGRLNETTGDVFGQYGLWKSITDDVPWYKTLVKEIKRP